MSTVVDGITWLKPFELKDVTGAKEPKSIARELRKQMAGALKAEGLDPSYLDRCVYVIRMKGDYLIRYPYRASPVLYIGRGYAFGRLSSHLKNWLYEAKNFGRDVSVEVRICRPRRKNFADLYKHVEADLIYMFREKNGAIPFFNRRQECSYTDGVDYSDNQVKELRAAIGVGSGKRPKWSLEPLRSNSNYDVYMAGHEDRW